MPDLKIIEALKEHVIAGKVPLVKEICAQALAAGFSAEDILKKGLLSGMTEVGERFSKGEFFIPELLIAARAMKSGIAILEPELAKKPSTSAGKIVIGTVTGDLHDIGKNPASIMASAAGFEVVDLGIDAGPEKFVEAVRENKATDVGLSALLTTTMVNMEPIVQALHKSGFQDKIIVGGAPLTEEYAARIGADLYAADAAEGAKKLKQAFSVS